MMSFLTGLVTVSPTTAQEKPDRTALETGPRRAVRVEATIKAPVSEVWRVWTTSHGAEEFFAEKANIHLAIGGPYEIQFDPRDAYRQEQRTDDVSGLNPDDLVRWRVVDGGARDWIGTEIEFKIFRDQGRTLLHFLHSRWQEDAKAFLHCSVGWAIFLLSLKEFVETGKGRPHPCAMPVNMRRPPKEVTAINRATPTQEAA